MLVTAAAEAIDDPVLNRYRAAVVLGALREDVMYVPIVGRVVDLMGVVAVVRGQDRCADLLGDLEELRIRTNLLGNTVVLELDEEVVSAEDVLHPTGTFDRLVEIALEQ